MTRYQIKILDGNLSDLIHELAVRTTVPRRRGADDVAAEAAYCEVFRAVREVLRPRVRSFGVCGTRIGARTVA